MGYILRSLSIPFVDQVDEKGFARDFELAISRQLYVGGAAGFGQIVNLALDLLRSHGLHLDPNLTMAVKALMQAEAFTSLLFPEGGLVQEGTEIILEMVQHVVTPDKVVEVVKDQVMMSAREVLKRLPSLQEATVSWLDQYQKGRFEVTINTGGLERSVDKLARLGRLVVIALMLVGMIVGSANATSVIAFLRPVGDYWTFASRLAYLGFVVPMVVAILIVLRLLWRWIRGDNPLRD